METATLQTSDHQCSSQKAIRMETFEWGILEHDKELWAHKLSRTSCSICGVLQKQLLLGPRPRVDRKTKPDSSRKHHLSKKTWQRQTLRLIQIYRDERINKRAGDHHPKVSRTWHRTHLDGQQVWIWPFQSPQMSLKSLISFFSSSSYSPRTP